MRTASWQIWVPPTRRSHAHAQSWSALRSDWASSSPAVAASVKAFERFAGGWRRRGRPARGRLARARAQRAPGRRAGGGRLERGPVAPARPIRPPELRPAGHQAVCGPCMPRNRKTPKPASTIVRGDRRHRIVRHHGHRTPAISNRRASGHLHTARGAGRRFEPGPSPPPSSPCGTRVRPVTDPPHQGAAGHRG